MPSHDELAQFHAFAEETGAQHADRVLELLTEYPSELVPGILDFAQAMLDNTLAGLAAGIRERTATPESEIEHFITLVRAAYSARLALVLMPAAGSG